MAHNMAAEAASPATTPKRSFSRYRSVRNAQAHQAHRQEALEKQQQQAPPVPAMPSDSPAESQKESSISRSMSRYHRRPATSNSRTPPVRANTTDVPPLPTSTPNTGAAPRNRAISTPSHSSHATNNGQPRLPNASRSRTNANPPLVAQGSREPSETARDEARQLMQAEAERQRRMKEKARAEALARLEAEAAEAAERERQEQLRREEDERVAREQAEREAEEAEQLRREQEDQERRKRLQKAETLRRLQQQRDDERKAKFEETARKAHKSPPVSPQRHGGAFGLFRRRREQTPTSPETHQISNEPQEPDVIRPGGGGAVLGIDAPISAVNAGDRRVMVVCNRKQLVLPVTPTTTPLDLIKSASTCLTESIDVRTAVLLESFQKVSLTRPLRNYEHVRDVLNSWDEDRQNDLVIVDAAAAHINQQALLASQAPDSKPDGMGCYIYYSSRPGKWSKRYITLREDGQLLLAKNETAKDHDNICHLSDFDIYTPTERKITKVKPPKKTCYAVKSQQKSNIFSDESRYVHFFCTNDKNTASLFYRSLHGWRSWYLKHVMGEGQKKKTSEAANYSGFSPSRNVSGPKEHGPSSPSHARGESVGSHYQLGSFSPLLDLDNFGKNSKDGVSSPGSYPDDAPLAKFDSRAMHARKMSTRVKAPPPASYGLNALSNEPGPQNNSGDTTLLQSSAFPPESDTFAQSGLLGRAYTTRQRALQEREKKAAAAFTEGPSLLNNMPQPSTNDSGLGRRSSVRSNHHRRTSSDIKRSASVRQHMPKPLVDLTPQYQEPPQHVRKGKGFHPEPGAGPLVENATSIDEAIKVPSSTDWRARPSTARPHGTYGTGGHERSRSLKGRGDGLANYTINNHYGAPEDDSNAFTGGGLLARAGLNQGYQPVGRGVMDGSKARGPMLDMRENSQFALGSLLAGVERVHGPSGPVIERDKRQSVDFG